MGKEKFIRIYKEIDINDIKEHLLVYGDLSASCSHCQAVDIKLDAAQCPECKTDFKYIAFRNVRNHIPKLKKLNKEKPHLIFVDYDDFKRSLGAFKAEEFLR